MNSVTYLPYHCLWITYHFKNDHFGVDGILQAQHECFIVCYVFCALKLQAAWHQMILVARVNQNTPGSWVVMCLWSVEVQSPQPIYTRTAWCASTVVTPIAATTATIGTMCCTSFITINWGRKESQLCVWWGSSWPCRIKPQCCFKEVVVEHEFCEGQWFILTIDGSEIMLHVPLKFYLYFVALTLVWKPHMRPLYSEISI